MLTATALFLTDLFLKLIRAYYRGTTALPHSFSVSWWYLFEFIWTKIFQKCNALGI